MMVKVSARAYGSLPLYLYLVGAYSKFINIGKCFHSPLILQIQSQSLCNAQCSICPHRVVSKKLDQGTMDWSLFEKIATEAASAPLLSTVVFSLHNEPLIDKRTFDWVKHLKSISPNKYCQVTTNGELLDRFSSTDIMRSNLDELVISLNAHSREMYETINLGLSYDKVMENISHLLSNQALRQKVRMSYVLTEYNLHEVYQATHYWKSQGVKTRVCM
jgi:MoaA/NifB/PqqE/SkfB family radical SAM enzyme